MEQVDYLVIGHISKDQTPEGVRIGGTVSFAGRTAQALGCRTAVLTSAAPDFNFERNLPGIAVHRVASAATTTFTNRYTAAGRQQTIHALASPLTSADVPADWQRAAMVHLAPIANEVDAAMIHDFSNSLVALTPQGWMRRWDENGRVYAQEWPQAQKTLPLASAVILSEEDLQNGGASANDTLAAYRKWARLLILTQGARGCTVFLGDNMRQIPAPVVTQVEPTGAGDIFAAAFLIRLYQTDGNPWEAARFANKLAAQSVTQNGLEAKIKQVGAYAAAGK